VGVPSSVARRRGQPLGNETSVFRRLVRMILPHSVPTSRTMRIFFTVFALALITIAFEVYSDTVLTSAEVSHTAAPDPATVAIIHGLKHD
jgi:hypothetical protein